MASEREGEDRASCLDSLNVKESVCSACRRANCVIGLIARNFNEAEAE